MHSDIKKPNPVLLTGQSTILNPGLSIIHTYLILKRRAESPTWYLCPEMSSERTWGKVESDISNKSQSVESYMENINSLIEDVCVVLSLDFTMMNNGISEKKTDRTTTYAELAYNREKMLKRQ